MLISVCRLQEVLKEYDGVVADIPENVLPLMKPFTNRVDETIKPGLTMLNWTSLNVHSCEYLAGCKKSYFNTYLTFPGPMRTIKGHCHGDFSAFQ